VRKKTGGRSFTEIGEICYGTPGKTAVNVSLGLCQLGYPIAFLFFIIQNFYDLIQYVDSSVHEEKTKNWVAFFWFLIFVGICWVRKLTIFAKTHVFADVMIMLMLMVVVWYGLK